MATVTAADIRTIITDPEGAPTLVREADRLGQDLKSKKLTTNQIRALFGEVRQIQAQWSMGEEQQRLARRRLTLLKPKMRYRAEKEKSDAVRELVAVLEPGLDIVISEKDQAKQKRYFQHFVDYFEAILAYHKAYGGS